MSSRVPTAKGLHARKHVGSRLPGRCQRRARGRRGGAAAGLRADPRVPRPDLNVASAPPEAQQPPPPGAVRLRAPAVLTEGAWLAAGRRGETPASPRFEPATLKDARRPRVSGSLLRPLGGAGRAGPGRCGAGAAGGGAAVRGRGGAGPGRPGAGRGPRAARAHAQSGRCPRRRRGQRMFTAAEVGAPHTGRGPAEPEVEPPPPPAPAPSASSQPRPPPAPE